MPDINSFVVTLAIMLVPGYLGTQVYRSLGKSERERAMKSWGDFLQVLVFALVGHLPGLILSELFDAWRPPALLTLSDASPEAPHWLFDLIVPFCVAAAVGMAAAAVADRRLLYRWVARPIGIRRYREDVWTHLMSSQDLGWIYLRDYRFGLVYKGWIQLYSDSGTNRELVLEDVEVFDNASGVLLYDVPRLYISRDQYDISVEIMETDMEEFDGKKRRCDSPA